MRSAHEITNCVEACLLEGRQQLLDKLLNDLEESEHALSDYLETKRLAFPRFYFISSTDLLDILANGHTPHYIGRHLPKLFQGLETLEFRKDGDRFTKYDLHHPLFYNGTAPVPSVFSLRQTTLSIEIIRKFGASFSA